MTPTDDLFRLIKSLSRSEKGYFKKYSTRHTADPNSAYLQLFDAIERQEEYNETEIRENFRDTSFIRRLPALKNYLYNLILRCLRSYYAEQSASRRLRGLLDDYTTLIMKELYEQADKVLERARALAEKHNLYYYRPLIEQQRRQLRAVESMAGATARRVEESLAVERAVLEELVRLNGLEIVNKRLFRHISEQGARGTRPTELQALLDSPLMAQLSDLSWPGSRFIFYQIHSTYAYYTYNYQQSRYYAQEALQLIEAHPEYASQYPYVASSLLSNIASLSTLLYERDAALQAIEKLRALPDRAYMNPIERITAVPINELTLYVVIGDIDSLRSELPRLQKNFTGLSEHLNSYYERHINYYMGWAHLLLGEPAKALHYINAVLNDRTTDVREDLYCFARIINLIIHYELGNTRLLRSEVRSTWRYLVQKQRTYRFETLLIQFIKRAITATSVYAVQQEFTLLRSDLEALRSDPFESRAFTYFHFIPWLESHITGSALIEVVQQYIMGEKKRAAKWQPIQ